MTPHPIPGSRRALPATVLSSLAVATAVMPLYAQSAPTQQRTATIRADPDYLTMINVFTPTTGTQDEVAAAVQAGLEDSVGRMPGFIRSTVHRSKDDARVVVYAQWRDQASVDAAVAAIQDGAAPEMPRALTIARSELHPCDVLSVHARPGGRPT
jgi:heme-degrading monooxygenase HmoA